jgi:RNA polymerase sigma-70 factor (ECF subfamily)
VSNPVQGKGLGVLDSQEQVRFEMLVLPHLDAAFNLARWLLRSGADADDAAQEAMLRSYRFFHGFHGGDVRAWLLQIVRNTCYTWLEKNRRAKDMTEFDEQWHGPLSPTPEALAIAGDNRERLTYGLESLSPRHREVIVLRELEGCSYKEISTITSIRLDVVHGRAIAALVYGRRKHLVSAFIWPTSEQNASPRAGSRQGYQWISWRKGGMEFCVVSDVAPSDLEQLQRLFTE